MENDCKMVEAMTRYQKAVSDHMETAPQELRDYVCGRLVKSDDWVQGNNPIIDCEFLLRTSKEGLFFWAGIANKDWQEAMDTDFWESREEAKR
jgi:hypothetical protein